MATVQTAKKLLLGREIDHMMKAAGKTPADLAVILQTSRSRIGQILEGKGTVSVGDLERLATQLGFPDPGHHETLFELRKDSNKRGFWTTGYRRAYGEELRVRVDVEMHADHIREFEVEVVPGLLQHEEYVRGLYAGYPETDGLTIEDRIEARTARQKIFHKDNPPEVHFVMSESCLRRERCDPPAMIRQLEYIIELSQRPNVMIQVLPFKQRPGRRLSISNRFTLLRMPSKGVAGPMELAYTEAHGEFRFMDASARVDAYNTAWTRLTAAALPFEKSRGFLGQMITEFRDAAP